MSRWGSIFAAVLTYDFCPWANRWVYWAKRPIASLGLAAAAALACAIFVKPIALVGFGAVLFVIVLGYLWPSLAVRGLSGSLQFRHERITEGEPVRLLVRIRNHWPLPVWGIAIEGGFETGDSVALARVGGWSTAEFEWDFPATCRGVYPTAPPQLITGFPFGLRQARRTVRVERTLLVWPRIIPLETLLDAAETRPSDDQFSDRRVGDNGDITGTRLFRNGDSLRRVHWAQTARQGRMIVSERQAPTQSAIRVVFDSDPRLHRGAGADSTLEWSIRIAASVCAAYHRENSHVECCFGHETISLSAGPSGWRKFLDTLARWQPCHHDHISTCGHEHAQQHCRRIHHRNCGVFQLTITTDLGVEHRTEHRHVHGDHRLVVLKTAGFAEQCSLCDHEHPPLSRQAIVLEHPREIDTEFRRKWRSVCHAG